jgi:hypothetical protein
LRKLALLRRDGKGFARGSRDEAPIAASSTCDSSRIYAAPDASAPMTLVALLYVG